MNKTVIDYIRVSIRRAVHEVTPEAAEAFSDIRKSSVADNEKYYVALFITDRMLRQTQINTVRDLLDKLMLTVPGYSGSIRLLTTNIEPDDWPGLICQVTFKEE